MTDTDLATSGGEDSFTAEEQAAFEAYERGEDAGAGSAADLAGGEAVAPGGEGAPEAAAAAGEAAAAPGDVVDPDADDADDAEANKGRFVRHGAFHRERMLRKERDREIAELRERFARGDERLRVLSEAIQRAPQTPAAEPAAAVEPAKVPDPNEDIFGYVKHLQDELAALKSGQHQMTEAQKQAETARQEQEQVRGLVSDYQRDVTRMAQSEPQFADAYRHLMNNRIEELKHFGLDHAQAVKQAEDDELAIIRSAKARGVSPAEAVFTMAKHRGFQPKAPDPAPAAQPQETAAEKAERIAKGQAASKSLSAAGGAPAGEVTLEMLASMSEKDFEKFASANPAKLAALMGA